MKGIFLTDAGEAPAQPSPSDNKGRAGVWYQDADMAGRSVEMPAAHVRSGAAMIVRELPIAGLKLIQLEVHGDARGFFVERFNADRFREAGLPYQFVQDNHSRSAFGVVRGLHYQYAPAQGKLISVMRGRILDVAVDLRSGSPTFGQHFAAELSDLNGLLLWIPAGFAHGFSVIGDESADLHYKVDAMYNAQGESGISWNDKQLAVPWGVTDPVLSARDRALESLKDYCRHPKF